MSFDDKRILEWLTPLSPSSHHFEALKRFQEGILGWFFQSPLFEQWRDGQNAQKPEVLWCRGHMGAGKTTLIAQILEHLRDRSITRGSLAIAYCRYAERNSQSLEAILGLILAQLYECDKHGFDIPSYVREAFEAQSCHYRLRPQASQLSRWMQNRFSSGKPIYVLLDAIDELDALLVRNILCHLKADNVKLLVTSRNIPVIRQEFSSVGETEICANQKDIQIMVLARLQNESNGGFQHRILNKPARNPRFSSVKEEIVSSILVSATHMYAVHLPIIRFLEADHTRFLLASLHVDRVLVCTNVNDVYRYLEEIPSQATALYDQAWKRAIGTNDPYRARRIKTILMWLSLAEESLSVSALNEALCASERQHSGTELLSTDDIVSACAGFVRVEFPPRHRDKHKENSRLKSPLITLSHLSAHQYLRDRREVYFHRAGDAIVAACVFYCSAERLYNALSIMDTVYP